MELSDELREACKDVDCSSCDSKTECTEQQSKLDAMTKPIEDLLPSLSIQGLLSVINSCGSEFCDRMQELSNAGKISDEASFHRMLTNYQATFAMTIMKTKKSIPKEAYIER